MLIRDTFFNIFDKLKKFNILFIRKKKKNEKVYLFSTCNFISYFKY